MAKKVLILMITLIIGLMITEVEMARINDGTRTQRITYNPKPGNDNPSGLPTIYVNGGPNQGVTLIPIGNYGGMNTGVGPKVGKGQTVRYVPANQRTSGKQGSITIDLSSLVQNRPLSQPEENSNGANPVFGDMAAVNKMLNSMGSTLNPMVMKLFDLTNSRRQPTSSAWGDIADWGYITDSSNPFTWGDSGQTPVTIADQSKEKKRETVTNYWGGYGGGGGGGVSYNPWNWFFSLLNWRI
jgi:hypothetical protein